MVKSRIICALVSMILAQGALEAQAAEPRALHVTGVGSVTAVPDQVLLTAGIEMVDKSASTVKTKSDEVMRKLIAVATRAKVDDKDMQTDRLVIEVDQVGNPEESLKAPVKYRARRTLRVRLRDISRYEELVAAFFGAGVNTLFDIDFQSSRLNELKNEARVRAFRDAKANAEVFAKEAGLKLGKPLSIHDSEQALPPNPMLMRSMKMGAEADGSTLAVGELKIQTTVQVTYEFE
jgi:uncharacterized protein YggE